LCYDEFAGIFLPCVGVCYVEIGVLVRAGMIEGVGLYSRGSVVSVSTVVCSVVYCYHVVLIRLVTLLPTSVCYKSWHVFISCLTCAARFILEGVA
jgi:hypothetical protein